MTETGIKAPWKDHLGELPFHLEYFQGSMYEAVKETADKYPDLPAYAFFGTKTTYNAMMTRIAACARSFKMMGIRQGDRVTIALPNCPQAIMVFYALNCIGAVANVVHPLSAEKELEEYVNISRSRMVVTLDQFYDKFAAIRDDTGLETIVLTSIRDEMNPAALAGYMVTEGRKLPRIRRDAPVIWWREFQKLGRRCRWQWETPAGPADTAVIIYSGGTTGTTKGVKLTNFNFSAHAAHIVGVNQMFAPGDRMLAALPIFHGFGLGVCIHSMLANGGCSILMPRFTAESYSKLLVKTKCNFIAGVPTLFEAMTRTDVLGKADLSFLKGAFSGGDSLSIELKSKIDKFLADHGSPIYIREGYGATETIAAICLTPPDKQKTGSIGLPFPDTYIRIVDPESGREMPFGETGEILICGPTVMRGYVNNKEETEKVLEKDADGNIWCHTGDLGYMDSEGFVFFKGRIKRMIVSSGYNIYPAQMENMLNGSRYVRSSCVIGVPDPYRMQKIKAFVVLNDGFEPGEETWLHIMAYCKKNVARYAMPYDIEFRDELPLTKLGKIDYRALEEEEMAKIAEQEEQAKLAAQEEQANEPESGRS